MSNIKNHFLVFDLDGTLIDTLPFIHLASLKYLKDYGYNYTYTKDEVKSFIGRGARNLFAKLIKNDDFCDAEYATFLSYYQKEQNQSKIYKGVVETLKILEKEYELIIYSNKPDVLLQPLIKNKFNDINFLFIQGQDDKYPLKPDPTLLEFILKKHGFSKDFGFFIGDSDVDVALANNANIRSIAVTYGYGDINKIINLKPTYLIDSFKEINNILKG